MTDIGSLHWLSSVQMFVFLDVQMFATCDAGLHLKHLQHKSIFNSHFLLSLFQASNQEGHHHPLHLPSQLNNTSVIEKTIREEEEDRSSAIVSPGARGSGAGSHNSRERGGTISIKINGQMREVPMPNSVSNWWTDKQKKKLTHTHCKAKHWQKQKKQSQGT